MGVQQKPQVLYRGVTLDYNVINRIKFYGVDIVPYYEPLIDSSGRKTDKAGNEYGVYMSDNYQMSSEIYAKTNDLVGTPIDKDFIIRVDGLQMMIRIPSVEVLYKIDPTNIDVHRPWITSYLEGTYHGDEWVAEKVPASEYAVTRLTIGPDLLHDKENVDISSIAEAEAKVKHAIERRRQQLEALYSELRKLPVSIRYQFEKIDLEIFKDIFGDNGVKYVDYDNVNLSSGIDFIKYLIRDNWISNSESIDFSTLRYIEKIKQKMPQGFTVDDLIKALRTEKNLITASKEKFIQRKKANSESADTTNFDLRIARVSQFIDKVVNKARTSNDEMHMEEEFGKVIDSPKSKSHRPVISDAVIKTVILNDKKQKLREMKQQLLDEQQKRQQEVISNEEEEEEQDMGMTM